MKARTDADNYFVTRTKDNMLYEVVNEREQPDDKELHILCDQVILLTGTQAIKSGIETYALRRVTVYDPQKDRTPELLTKILTGAQTRSANFTNADGK